jgi:hypothetical protein
VSTQRICDLDGTIINPTSDLFYTVTAGRSGAAKDICAYCAQSRTLGVWVASTAVGSTQKVRPVAGLGKYVFVATADGTTGATEPAWPTTNGHAGDVIVDGTVRWQAFLAPNENATVKVAMPGATNFKTSLFGWMAGTNEPVS